MRQFLAWSALAPIMLAAGCAAGNSDVDRGNPANRYSAAEERLRADAGSNAMASATASAPQAELRQVALARALADPGRTQTNLARDRYRNPAETLAFFDVDPNDTVVEIWPGGGWYTEILAPYLASGGGTLYAVASERGLGGVRKLMERDANAYGRIRTGAFLPWDEGTPVPDGSADVVLTFRNVHNWRMGSGRDNKDYAPEAFRAIYRMLKPGGVLGIVDHRLPETADNAREMNSGYIKTSTIRRLAEAAGFRYVGASEVNANPKDTADWPDGVWTLPPSLRKGDVDRDNYVAIGESDRMTLKFMKPM